MSTVFSCKTKDSQLKTNLEQYASSNGLSKSKAIEKLLSQALENKEKNGFTEVYQGEKAWVNGLLSILKELEAKSKELRLLLEKREGRNA
jgi:hypothetical protein